VNANSIAYSLTLAFIADNFRRRDRPFKVLNVHPHLGNPANPIGSSVEVSLLSDSRHPWVSFLSSSQLAGEDEYGAFLLSSESDALSHFHHCGIHRLRLIVGR
jgi:hypothetical protein